MKGENILAKEVTVKVQSVANYVNHNCKANGVINLTLEFMYGELTDAVQLLQCLSNDVKLWAKPNGKQLPLGMFRVQRVVVDHDGTCKITFNSEVDSTEINNVNELVTNEQFQVRFAARVEIEDEPEGEGGGENAG